MKWIRAEGSLLLMEERLAPAWGGVFSGGGDGFENDYDRACPDDPEYALLIEVGDGLAVVFDDEPLDTSVWEKNEDGFSLVRWVYAEDEKSVIDHLQAGVPDELYEELESFEFPVVEGKLILFSSPCSGTDREETLEFQMTSGTYRVYSGYWKPDEETALVLHKVVRAT